MNRSCNQRSASPQRLVAAGKYGVGTEISNIKPGGGTGDQGVELLSGNGREMEGDMECIHILRPGRMDQTSSARQQGAPTTRHGTHLPVPHHAQYGDSTLSRTYVVRSSRMSAELISGRLHEGATARTEMLTIRFFARAVTKHKAPACV